MLTYLGVAGWPVGHSRSPAMQNAALAATGVDGWRYLALPLPPDRFAETVRALAPAGFHGINVTIPHKEAALGLATEVSDVAAAVGAANTLTFGPGRAVRAENTDVPGLLAALPVDPAGRTALVLGAGGGARAAVFALLRAGAADVAVWNRSPERAATLAAALGGRAVERPEAAELVVNCTSVGLRPGDDALPLDPELLRGARCVADMAYRPGGTPLLAAAERHGAAAVSGIEILVAQGAVAFELWTGREAPRAVMRAAAVGR